jgi:transcriptional regulator with GAF, ATPase, and Fis domain
VSVRVLAATNRNLRSEVDASRFRLNLVYRISVFPIYVPALRERREDIAPLATRFLRAAGLRLQRTVSSIPEREMKKLVAYDWPGNIRELQHVVERAAILASQRDTVQFDVTPSPTEPSGRRDPDRPYRTEEEWRRMERDNLRAALEASGGKVTGQGGAAALLGINPNTLTSRLRALGLRKTFVG